MPRATQTWLRTEINVELVNNQVPNWQQGCAQRKNYSAMAVLPHRQSR